MSKKHKKADKKKILTDLLVGTTSGILSGILLEIIHMIFSK